MALAWPPRPAILRSHDLLLRERIKDELCAAGPDNHIATVAAITPVRSTAGHILLTSEADSAVPTTTAGDRHDQLI
jgi:hypothetical protein